MDPMFLMMTVGGLLITVVVMAGVGFSLWRVLGSLSKTASDEARILQTGMPGRAQILQVQMGGMSVTTGAHRRLEVLLALQVQPQSGAPFVSQIKTLVSELNIPQIQPGAWVQIRIDPIQPQRVAIEGFGVALAQPSAPMGGYGQPNLGGYGQPPGGMAPGISPMGFIPVAPAAGFKLPLGAKIGLVIGAFGALVGVGVAIIAVAWSAGVGGPSEICQQAADCCKKISGNAGSCDNFTRQNGMIADQVCKESLASFRQSGQCQ